MASSNEASAHDSAPFVSSLSQVCISVEKKTRYLFQVGILCRNSTLEINLGGYFLPSIGSVRVKNFGDLALTLRRFSPFFCVKW